MPSPVLPAEFQAVVSLPSDNLCDRFKKTFLRFPVLLYRWYRWQYGEDRDFSQQYKDMICAVDCAAPATTTTTP